MPTSEMPTGRAAHRAEVDDDPGVEAPDVEAPDVGAPDVEAPDVGAPGPPRWLPLASLAIVSLGLAVSSYLTYAHYTSATALACPGTTVINCERVTTSPQSHIVGIPVAVLGLVFFVGMGVLSLPAAWAATSPVIRYGRLLFSVTGIAMVFYLVYTELFTLDAICLWCTAVHLLTLLLFAVVVLGTVLTLPDPV
jgi:uncharacterized membrane protein